MPERATIFNRAQLGIETTPGTRASAGSYRSLSLTSIETRIQPEVTVIRPYGQKYPTAAAPVREWSTGTIRGTLGYADICYLLCGVSNKPTPQQQGTSQAYLWTFTPAQSAPDTIQTYTIQQGSSVRAHEATYGLVTGLTLNFNRREGCTVEGDVIAYPITDGATLESATAVDPTPVLPTQVTVSLGSTSSSQTELTRCLAASLTLRNRFAPVWVFRSTNPTQFAAHVESEPEATVSVMVEADATGMGLLTDMRSGAKKWLKISAVGPVADATYNYTVEALVCFEVTEVSEFRDEEGLYAIEWTGRAIYDATWGYSIKIDNINKLSAL